VQVLGLYATYHPKSKWKCPFCNVCCETIHDFSKPSWPMRTEEEVNADEQDIPTTKSGQKRHAKQHHGVQSRRILPFPRKNIIPCFLHCLSAIVKKLFKLLLRDTQLNDTVIAEWEVHLVDLGISLQPDKMQRFDVRVKNSRWGRPAWLAILQHHHRFINTLKTHAR
jgi:hypothetical protein